MIIDDLHKIFPDLSDLRMREIRVDKQQRRVSCTLSYPPSSAFDVKTKTAITDVIRKQIPDGYFCSVKFAEDNFTRTSFLRNLNELIKERYPIYAFNKQQISVDVTEREISVVFSVDGYAAKNLELVEFCQRLSDYYADYTCYNVSFSVRAEGTNQYSASVAEQEKLVQFAINRELMKPSRFFAVSSQRPLFGKTIPNMPMYIADLRKPTDNCTVCGIVSSKSCRQAKNNSLLQVCSFILTDKTGSSIPCVLFVRLQITDPELIMSEKGCGQAEAKTLADKRMLANDKKLKNILWLADNMSVAVHGKAVYGQSGQLELHVYDLCTCKIEAIADDKQFNRPVADEYLLIKPEDCTEYRQINFVDSVSEQSPLQDKTLVVLHVNATGLANVIEDKLVAICAVKLVNGHVCERLFSYVNPEKQIADDKLLEHCKLSQDKLIFYPTLTEIISDVYKFTFGSTLVGNNMQQIVQLLNYYASPMNYKFTNETAAQTEMLSSLFDNSTFTVSPNFAKLDDVAKKCKVGCNSTYFCYDTALTVAKCIGVLADNSK